MSQTWWGTPIIQHLGNEDKEDLEFEAILDYIARPHLKENMHTQVHVKEKSKDFVQTKYEKHTYE
jgi:hypothetical protein